MASFERLATLTVLGVVMGCSAGNAADEGARDGGPPPDLGENTEVGADGGSKAPLDGGTRQDAGGVATADKNGVAYLPIAGFAYTGERFDGKENLRGDGSMRHDFHETPDENQCVLGYFFFDGPANEEISAKLGGGPHGDANPEWADTYDLAVTNFQGTRARLRFEATHPKYTAGATKSIDLGDLRKKWVGAMGCKLNVDENGDGSVDKIRVLAWVDPSGLDAEGKPRNDWKNTLDLTLELSEVELKSPTIPYVVTIGHPDKAQATIRIDEQDADTYGYKFVAYRTLKQE